MSVERWQTGLSLSDLKTAVNFELCLHGNVLVFHHSFIFVSIYLSLSNSSEDLLGQYCPILLFETLSFGY